MTYLTIVGPCPRCADDDTAWDVRQEKYEGPLELGAFTSQVWLEDGQSFADWISQTFEVPMSENGRSFRAIVNVTLVRE